MNWSRVMLVGVALILPGCEMIDPAAFFSRAGKGERARIVRGPVASSEALPVVQASYRPAERRPAARADLRRSAPGARRAPVSAFAAEPSRASIDQALRDLDAALSPAAPAILPAPELRGSVSAEPRPSAGTPDPLLADRYDPRNDPNRALLLPEIPAVRIIDIDAVLDGLRGSGASD